MKKEYVSENFLNTLNEESLASAIAGAATIAGTVLLANYITNWMNIRKIKGFKECKGDPKCELKVINDTIREAKTIGIPSCRKSKNPEECVAIINGKIRNYERVKKKLEKKIAKM